MDYNDVEKSKPNIFQSRQVRWCIIASYWIIVLIGLPLWWSITSIERLPIPSVANTLDNTQIVFPLNVNIYEDENKHEFEPFIEVFKIRIQSNIHDRGVAGIFQLNIISDPSSFSEGQYKVLIKRNTSERIIRDNSLLFGTGHRKISEVIDELANTLSILLTSGVVSEIGTSRKQQVVQYSPRYRLAFSLLNEDSTSGSTVSNWDVHQAISRELLPTLDCLSGLYQFTIESQVQHYAPLSFSPSLLAARDDAAHVEYGLTPEQLTVFINSAEWTLSSSVSNDPVLHFVLFTPSKERRPLHILNSQGIISKSTAFIVPQWGGIYIFNPDQIVDDQIHVDVSQLSDPFSTFRSQLLSLVGIPALPKGILTSDLISRWQLDSLQRRRILENVQGAKETLSSISKLVDQIEGMPVGKGVQDDIQKALDALLEISGEVDASSRSALEYSSKAFILASRAFFNPGMLAMLYFPAEHKLAVYTPLFAPIAVPLILSVLRELKSRKMTNVQTID